MKTIPCNCGSVGELEHSREVVGETRWSRYECGGCGAKTAWCSSDKMAEKDFASIQKAPPLITDAL
jgi:hypothetical protein